MADREEQLLNELLRGIAREDASLDAPHLESRVIDAAVGSGTLAGPESQPSPGHGWSRRKDTQADRTRPTFSVLALAAAAVVALGVAATLNRGVPQSGAPATVAAPPQKPIEMVVNDPPKASPRPVKRATKAAPAPALPVAVNAEAVEQPALTPEPAASDTTAEFVPLLPLTAQELTGPFQLVRVQMPRASLGPLRSPLDHPGELVEADVLLGEDGRARAIRISAAGSIYPWRRSR